MGRTLRTISIAFPFKNQNVVFEPTFSTSRALFDFDVVVVRPYSFQNAPSARSGGDFRVDWREFNRAKNEIESKNEDIARLLNQGGLLVLILDALEVLHCYSSHDEYSVANYDFLSGDFWRVVRNGTGDRITVSDPSDPFARAIKNSSVEWTAFLSGRPPHPFNDMDVFAGNGAGALVGASMASGTGHIVFLPNFKTLDENAFFEACQEYRFGREGTPAPSWVAAMTLPGEEALTAIVSAIGQEINKLQELRSHELQKKDDLLSYKKLLFEKGKYQLEPVVRKALIELNFAPSAGEHISGTQFEIDGRTQAGSVPGMLEIKGSKNQITLDEFSPFVTKVLADFQNTKVHSKGILIGNGLCLEPPQKRLGTSTFSPHVLDAAARNSIVLINSVELYCLISEILGSADLNLEAIREKILTTNGYVNLAAFVTKLPF